MALNTNDKAELLEFAQDHINHFGCIPLEFETEAGELISYGEVWQVCEEAGLTEQIHLTL